MKRSIKGREPIDLSKLKRLFQNEKKMVKVKPGLVVSSLEKRHISIYLDEHPLVVINGETADARHLLSKRMKELCRKSGYTYLEDTSREEMTILTKDKTYRLIVDYYYEVHEGEVKLHMNEMVILFPEKDNKVDFSSAYHFLSSTFFHKL